MKRVVLLMVAGLVLCGGLAWGQWWQPCCPPPSACPPPPCCPPAPPEPSCYDGFWVGEPILVEVVIPQGRGCCCEPTFQITGWSVYTMEGREVYDHVFAAPVHAGTQILWHQVNQMGARVAAGFYRISVRTTNGRNLSAYVRIADRAYCRSSNCTRPAKPCGVSICDPRLKLSPFPICGPCCDTCCDPCCLQPFYIIGGGR